MQIIKLKSVSTYLSVMESMFHACKNMGDFLSLVRHWSSSHSSALIKSVNSPIHIEVAPPPLLPLTKEKMEKNTATDDQVSNFWQHQLTGDIMETIVMRLSLTDRIRMSRVCKSWRAPLLMDNKNLMINGGAGATPDIPWLLFPRGEGPAAAAIIDNRRLFSFYSMSEGRFYNLELPKKALGGHCCGCIRGWLAITTESDFKPQLFLWNPLSGALLELPSLTTIPCFQEFLSQKQGSFFINRIDILFVNSSAEQHIVAILCNYQRALAFCTLGDTRWIIFKENIDDKLYSDILFINNLLYTVDLDVNISTDNDSLLEERDNSVVETHTIVLTNNCQVVMKSIKHVFDWGKLPSYEIQPGGFVIGKHTFSTFSLLESAQGELLIARENIDFFKEKNEDDNYESPGPGIEYYQTKGFEIFKVDIHSLEMMHKLTSLGDQVLFYSEHSTLSIPTRKFGLEFQKENCIYFATTPFCRDPDNFLQVSREAGVFNLEDGTIKRFLPSFKFPLQSAPVWLTPNLHLLPR